MITLSIGPHPGGYSNLRLAQPAGFTGNSARRARAVCS
jgi:hypothetical protein